MPQNTKLSNTLLHNLFALFFHCIIGILICLAIAAIFSVLIAYEKIDAKHINLATFVSIYAGAFVSCYLTSRKFGKNIFSSLIQCITYLFILFIIGAIMFSRLLPEHFPLSFFTAPISGAVTAAFLSALFKRKRR